MRFTLSWLFEHLQTSATLQEICHALNMIGLEVENVETNESLKKIVIAKVLECKQHPNADRLKLLQVDTGQEKLQVVCGAPNAKKGMVGAFAPVGTYIKGIDVTLTKANIRGIESHGMMCSEKELEISNEHEGIIELDENTPIGKNFAKHMGLDDPVIEIAITPNRGDALGVAGIARDLAAYGLGELKKRPPPEIRGGGNCPTKINIAPAAKTFCPAFGLTLIKNVKNTPSPQWLQQRLRAIGLRPISALVDITNYITYEYARPLHVFDFDKIKGDLTIRPAKQGEQFQALDGKTYTLNSEHFVIADEAGAESLAGIMGGEQSGCSLQTKNVLLESALWQPLTIAKTGRELNINSDARYRFERGVDPAFMVEGLARATQLIIELCGGEATAQTIEGEMPNKKTTIEFPLKEIKRLTSIEIEKQKVIDILEKLGFIIKAQTEKLLTVAVPTFRADVTMKADLVEEVMRIYGVDNIKPQALPRVAGVAKPILTAAQIRVRNVKRLLAVRAMSECVCYSFIPENHARAFGGGGDSLKLSNPISSELTHMRPSLLPSLLAAAKRNVDRGIGNLALFEVSHVYSGLKPNEQHRVAAGVRRGTAGLENEGRHWQSASPAVDVFLAKEDALAVLAECGVNINGVQFIENGGEHFHLGRSGKICLGRDIILGKFGEFHPIVLELFDIAAPICGFEIFLDNIPENKKTKRGALVLSNLQAVHRDFAFIVASDVNSADIIRAARVDKNLITNVKLFDMFMGDELGAGKKSLAIEVVLQPQTKNLTDEDIDEISKKIITNVEKQAHAVLRS